MEEHKHEEHKHEEKEGKKEVRTVYVSKNKKNPWMAYTAVLAIVCVILAFFLYTNGGMTGNSIDKDVAGTKLVEYLNSRTGGGVELVSTEDSGSLYKVMVAYQGDEIPVYITKDGDFFVQGVVPITPSTDTGTDTETTTTTTTEVPKSDKPVVELFIWGYCPYGVQAQGPLADVAKLLGEDADFEAVLYYDGHGAFETQQNKIQECIQEVAPDKYWDYASGFVEDIYPKCSSTRDVECDKTESIQLMKSLGISTTKVMDCVDEKGDELFAEAATRAQEYGVTGSPTLVINGVKVNTARTSEAFKTAVCDAFNTAPETCSETLDSTAAAAAGNC